jgi:23S rRNA pseudouridine2605 synthase
VIARPMHNSTGFIPRDKGTPPRSNDKPWDKKPASDRKTAGGKWAGKASPNVWAGKPSPERSGGYVASASSSDSRDRGAPRASDAARPAKAWAGKPSGGKSFGDKPFGDKLGGGKPWAGKSGAGKLGAGKSGGSKPWAGKSGGSSQGFKPRAKPGKG